MTKILVVIALLMVGGLGVAFASPSRATPPAAGQDRSDMQQIEIESIGQAVEQAKQDVEKFGWHLLAITGQGDSPGFVFTIGLWKTYRHPDLILFAPGDPREIAGRLNAVAKRVAAGEVFAEGKAYEGLFGKFSGSLRPVRRSRYVEFLGIAPAFYGSYDFPVLQLFWSDEQGLFPWQGGFEPGWFGAQPLLGESNLVLANVGLEVRERLAEEEGPEALRASWAELFVDLPADHRDSALEAWRWLVGPNAKFFRVTIFGDLFLQTPDGHFHWLDTGSATYEEVAPNEAEWLETIADDLPYFFHASTLLAFRDLKFLPKAGEVYSWLHAPMLGGEEKAANFETVSATVHIAHLGQLAHALKDVPLGTKISGVDFTPMGPAGTDEDDPARRFQVVINAEEQYSMWPEGEKIPDSWKSVGKAGTKQECLDYIKEVWVDMRPLSLRKAMDAQGQDKPQEKP